MKSNPTVREILSVWLKANGYDGLYLPGICGCRADDLAPCCDSSNTGCQAGYQQPCDCGEGCKFHIGPKRKVTR